VRIFVFEFITGGGLLPEQVAVGNREKSVPRVLDSSLLAEGLAMVTALASDFSAIQDCRVHVLQDGDVPLHLFADVSTHPVHNQAEYQSAFVEQAAAADWTVLIAPECQGSLLERVETALACGGRLLSPGPQVVRPASDKHATAEHLWRAGVPAPRGAIWTLGEPLPADLQFPLVVKPRDGAGSQGVRLVHSLDALRAAAREMVADSGDESLKETRVEEYAAGVAVSVAFLCGPRERVALPACEQRLSSDGHFTYLGGMTPLAAPLAARATALARRAINTLADPFGYLGVDLVLGVDPAGSGDRVIEINPRLTTSYVGLRAAVSENLAAAMLRIALGQPGEIGAVVRRVEFTADGRAIEIALDENAVDDQA